MQEKDNKQFSENESRAFLTGLSEDFRRLRQNSQAWQEHEQEMALWDNVLADGLEIAQADNNRTHNEI